MSPFSRCRPIPSPVPVLLALLLAGAAPSPASGQAGSGGADTPEAAVRGLFDAMRDADSAAARRLLHPDVRLHRPVPGEEGTTLRTSGAQEWLDAIGQAEPGRLDEKIWSLEVRTDGDLATAWMRYAFYVDGVLHHCGVNAFQLVRVDGGWRAFSLADTSRREGCEGPPAEGGR